MSFLRKILKAPIRRTLIIMLVSVAIYIVFILCSNYLLRVMCADVPDTAEVCRGTSFQRLANQICGDFVQLARITFVLSFIALIAQSIYRVVRR